VDDELAAAPQLLIIELSGLAKLLSTGVSALVRAAFHAGEADIVLCLVGAARTDIARQLEATGRLDLFEVHDTVDAAITEIGSPHAGFQREAGRTCGEKRARKVLSGRIPNARPLG
jgi:hypothetical protein